MKKLVTSIGIILARIWTPAPMKDPKSMPLVMLVATLGLLPASTEAGPATDLHVVATDKVIPASSILRTRSTGATLDEGLLLGVDGDSLRLERSDGMRVSRALTDVDALWVRAGSGKTGAIAGGLLGALGGGFVGLVGASGGGLGGADTGETAGLIGLGALGGGLLGAAIGVMIGSAMPRWREVCSLDSAPCDLRGIQTQPQLTELPRDPKAGRDEPGPSAVGTAAASPGLGGRMAGLMFGPTLSRFLDEGDWGGGFRITLLLHQQDRWAYGPEIGSYKVQEDGSVAHLGLIVAYPLWSGPISGYAIGGPGLYIFPFDVFGGFNVGLGSSTRLGSGLALTAEVRGHWTSEALSEASVSGFGSGFLGFTVAW